MPSKGAVELAVIIYANLHSCRTDGWVELFFKGHLAAHYQSEIYDLASLIDAHFAKAKEALEMVNDVKKSWPVSMPSLNKIIDTALRECWGEE